MPSQSHRFNSSKTKTTVPKIKITSRVASSLKSKIAKSGWQAKKRINGGYQFYNTSQRQHAAKSWGSTCHKRTDSQAKRLIFTVFATSGSTLLRYTKTVTEVGLAPVKAVFLESFR